MAGFWDILNTVLTLGIAASIGFVCVRSGYISDKTRDALSTILVRVTLPILVVTTMTKLEFDKERLLNCVAILVIAWLSIGTMYAVGLLGAKIFRFDTPRAMMHSFMSCFGNIVFVAYPLIRTVYGDEGILYAALFAFANDCVLWTFCVCRLASSGCGTVGIDWKKLANPGTIAVLISFVMMALKLRFGGILKDALEGIGSVTTYLSMIFLGGTLAMIDFGSIFKRRQLFVLSAVKLLVLPTAIALALAAVGIDKTVAGVAVFQTAMPVSTVLIILAAEYKCDVLYGAEGTFISTAASIITLPAIYAMIEKVIGLP